MSWIAARYGAKTFGLGRSGGPGILQVRHMDGRPCTDEEFRILVQAMVAGLNEYEPTPVPERA